MRRTILVCVAAALAGCGDRTAIRHGGSTPGQILTVYALVPRTPDGADLIRGAKLALSQAGGRVGKLTVQFASHEEPATGDEPLASAVRDVVRDTGTIAVIGDLDAETASVTAPLFNAVGVLQVSPVAPAVFAQPAAGRTFFAVGPTVQQQAAAIVAGGRAPFAVEAEPGGEALAAAVRAAAGRTVPTGRARTVVYAGTDPVNARGAIGGILRENRRAQVITTVPVPRNPRVRLLGPATTPPAGFAAAFPGAQAGHYARFGYGAMNAVLAALKRAGRHAQSRQAVVDAFVPPAPLAPTLTR